MAYVGQQASIPLGQLGLKTDDPMTSLPPNAAIKAFNVDLFSSKLSKSKGSVVYNNTALGAPVVGVCDWYPLPSSQRMIALTSDGKMWRDSGDASFMSNTPIATGLGPLGPDSMFVTGGNEVAGRNKKLFVFTGTSQVKVLSGDSVTPTNLALPSADFASGNYPTGGAIFQNRLCVFGVASNPHTIYFSDIDDHEKFNGSSTACPIFTVFPGESDKIAASAVYKGRLFFFKKPFGVYYLETQNSPVPTDWSVQKLTDSFGIASAHSAIQALDDLIVANSSGGINSLQATQAFGDLKAGDILANAQVEDYLKEQLSHEGISYTHAIFYGERKKALFTGRSAEGAQQDRILIIDIARQTPRISLESKDQVTCLSLRKDSSGIERPFYGSNDGNIYLMEQGSYSVDGAAYNAEFQTPYIDFSYLDQSLSSKNKIFDFLEIFFVNVGAWSFNVDVFIDNRFSETISIMQSGQGVLGNFILDTDRLSNEFVQSRRIPIRGSGRRVSFKIYNNQASQYFKIEKLVVNFRLSAEQQTGFSGVYTV